MGAYHANQSARPRNARGKARIRRITGGLYEPDQAGKIAFLTPVLTHYPDTPESPQTWGACRVGNLIDLIAWHPRHPDRWALRTGDATWLGSIEPQYAVPPPVAIRRSPLSWLQSDCDGLVILARDSSEVYRLLSNCVGGIIADDALHARELREFLERRRPLPKVTVALQTAPVRHAA
jgi:hypothetical protein